ncbi:TolC family protein [Chitinophaga sp. SYP-B3965]|uniref:TolC family protein n=1 Tax=Chitinophaga sp. SYP-B3965 TaxID=2663120 RepID=UPI0012997C76|nr:TolC family protein [Chitinophaga sp. SYP-B3965]MRG44174.1 TolC family protein [Chitinophaga sp. SYP-B3965]
MLPKIIKLPLFTSLVLVTQLATAQSRLDDYIQEGFSRNQAIARQNFQLEKSMYALQEAKALFMPSASVISNYTKASGGRTIDIPTGDMLNGVYSTLNQLTGSQKFPQLANQSIQLTPDNFYDAKVRASMPLINTEIMYAKKIRQEDITRQQATVNVYKRQLVKDIKTAYYQYYQATRAVDIYNNALVLVKENIRVNQSMLNNGIRNNTSLTRAQTEQQKTEAAITQAENTQQNARAYFNFLLNKPLTDSIQLDSTALVVSESIPATSTQTREEIQQLTSTKNMALLQQKMQHSLFVPKVNTFLDLGSQGYNFAFNNTTRYYLWGVNLQWDIFTGGQRKYRTKQAGADASMAQTALDETKQGLELELNRASNNYRTAYVNYKSAQTQLQLAEKYFRDQMKVYKEGQLLYIELLDAQNQLTNSRLQLLQAYAQVQISQAEIERAQAGYPLTNLQ